MNQLIIGRYYKLHGNEIYLYRGKGGLGHRFTTTNKDTGGIFYGESLLAKADPVLITIYINY